MRHPCAGFGPKICYKAVTDIFGGGQKAQVLPAPQPTTPPPTVDDAANAASADAELNKRKGRLASFISSSSSSASLGGGVQESALKRMLGA